MDCVRHEELLDVLYDDPDAPAREQVEAHLKQCAACRAELEALKGVRGALKSWRVNEPAPRRVTPPRWAWPLAVAATLLLGLGAGLALSGSELRFEEGRFAFRLGRNPQGDVREQVEAQDARHRAELAELRAELTGGPAGAIPLDRVRAMLRESEQRNALLVGASLAELSDRYEAQRRYDLARVSASLSYLDGRSGQQLARTSELMNVMLRAAEQE